MIQALAALTILACAAQDEKTLITTTGEKLRGHVTRSGPDYVISTVTGPRTLPPSRVVCVFGHIIEIHLQCDERFRRARDLYEEASKLNDTDPSRNQKLKLAVEVSQDVANLYNAVLPHYPEPQYNAMRRNLQRLMQFIRLCRGSMSSEVTTAEAGGVSDAVPLKKAEFTYTPPPDLTRPWVLKGDLGPGLETFAKDLDNPNPASRLRAVKTLTHPPALEHLPALLKLLETETDPRIQKMLATSLPLIDSRAVFRALAWVKESKSKAARDIIFTIALTAADRTACEFLVDWLVKTPPTNHEQRAQFASAFRRLRSLAVPLLKDNLRRSRGKSRTEIIMQMGALRDTSFVPLLLTTMKVQLRDAVVALRKIGHPALPTLISASGSSHQQTRKWCNWLCRDLTRVRSFDPVRYQQWWNENRRRVLEKREAWWKRQAASGYPVSADEFEAYEKSLENLIFE